LNEKLPRDQVKRLCYVDLEEHGRAVAAVKPSASKLYRHEVVMDGSSSDECTLVVLDQQGEVWSQAGGQHLSDKLADAMHQANGPVVF
jgi:hypothetical protein